MLDIIVCEFRENAEIGLFRQSHYNVADFLMLRTCAGLGNVQYQNFKIVIKDVIEFHIKIAFYRQKFMKNYGPCIPFSGLKCIGVFIMLYLEDF